MGTTIRPDGGRTIRHAGKRRPKSKRSDWLGTALLTLGLLVLPVAILLAWGALPSRTVADGRGQIRVVRLPEGLSSTGLAEALAEQGICDHPWAGAAYFALNRVHPLPGIHVLKSGLSRREIGARLSRAPGRAAARITIPEGFNHVQIAERLEKSEICSKEAFVQAARDPALLRELGVSGRSAEGYLFPATYELPVNSQPSEVVRGLVRETRERLRKLGDRHPGVWQRAKAEGFEEAQVIALASIVEKETAQGDERALVSSVYRNRLKDAEFKPKARLQADPTAAYGCIVAPDQAPSCAGFVGKITPAMLRDAANAYNTYRHEGLPPGPICNPGESALEAALLPAETDYLYFVATGGGRHTFSRTFEEHSDAVQSPR